MKKAVDILIINKINNNNNNNKFKNKTSIRIINKIILIRSKYKSIYNIMHSFI